MAPEIDSAQLNVLRPLNFDDFIGKESEKKLLKMMIDSAIARSDALDHLLIYGPPGLGKTTMAAIVARQMNSNIFMTSAPSISSKSDLASMLMNLNQGDVLFIDEIHRLNTTIEEFLYPVLEDYVMDITMGKGLSANVVRIPLKKFTLIGATTKISRISDPLRDRFGQTLHLDFYNEDEIKLIAKRTCKIWGINLNEQIINEIANRSRGTARVANKLVKVFRDYITVNKTNDVTLDMANKLFVEIGVDIEGLEKMDRKILETIYIKFNSQPVSLSTLVAAMAEDKKTIEDYYEPHLIKKGFIQKTTKGRIITPRGIEHIKKFITE